MERQARFPKGARLHSRHCPIQAWGVCASLVMSSIGLHATTASAISLSTKDSFGATSEGWQIGSNGIQPTQVSAVGPDGQTGYLSHFSDGGSANGKWLMWNTGLRWQGNYPAAGVTGISIAANVSSGSSPVSMRIAFDGPGGWFVSTAQSVGAGWSSYSFGLNQTDFAYVSSSGGTGTFFDTMSGVTKFEVLAGAGGVSYRGGGDLVQAGTSVNTILIDDISAVPEPTAVALVATGAALVAGVVRRRLAR